MSTVRYGVSTGSMRTSRSNESRLVESLIPEIVEIGWFGHGWPVVDEFLDSQVCPGHSDQPPLAPAKLDRA